MAMQRTYTLSLALSLGLVAACGDESPVDAGADAITIDVQDDATADVGQDPTVDATADTAPEVVEDTTPDTDEDTGADVPDTAPPPRCETDEECSDGLACTTDACDTDAGYCVWEVAPDTCLINGVCYDDGDVAPRNPCGMCDAAADATAWAPISEGEACDDGNICTVETTCQEGVCAGEALACEDGNPCTDNACDPELGCVFPDAAPGTTCDDGSACTSDDVCTDGACGGTVVSCDDGNECTDDSCDAELGCANVPNTAPCDDGDACTSGDVCAEGACGATGVTNCEDGNECTIDFCDSVVGCGYLPNLNPCCTGTTSICDDGDPCTTDICDPASGGCDYEANTAVCDDGNACTANDVCGAFACGGDTVTCPDDDPCMASSCDEDDGCVSEPLTGVACDDGVACTVADTCQAGVCVGTSECVCEPTFGLQAVKLTALRIGTGGRPGEALDLDADPTTCAPSTNCSDGRHNALGAIGPFANESLVEAVADGDFMLVLDIDNIALNPFRMAVFQGELAPSNPECDFQTEVCEYLVDRATLDPESCEPTVTLDATRVGSTVTAGGPGTVFPFEIPFGDSVLTITLYDVRFEGTIVIEDGAVVSLDGILGGAVPREDLLTALESVPADDLPLDPAAIANLLNVLVQDDIDTDGDGEPDAASIGLPISGIGAEVVGAE